jgi:hypothetical protein
MKQTIYKEAANYDAKTLQRGTGTTDDFFFNPHSGTPGHGNHG